MKIFVVTADIELTEKPKWLDDFRKRYDKPYKSHVTLKQTSFAEESQIDDIKHRLNELFKTIDIPEHKIELEFNALNIDDKDPNDVCIMINAAENDRIKKLQHDVVLALSPYTHYYKPEYEGYEKNFKPHITIGRDLNSEQLLTAREELKQDYTCKGIITKAILIVVDNFGPEEAEDVTRQTIYPL